MLGCREDPDPKSPAASAGQIRRLLRPRSIAIVGMSARPGSAGHHVLANLEANGYRGQVHLVGRGAEPILGRPCLPGIKALPAGVDLAIFSLPALAVEPALHEAIERDIGGVILFASGFAETGDEARTLQERIGAIATEGGVAMIGPNCIGFNNAVDGIEISFLPTPAKPRLATNAKPAVALIGQSGGMLTSIEMTLRSRNVAISFMITTGNEAALSVAHLAEFLAADDRTGVVLVYAEQIKEPPAFLEAVKVACEAGKTIVLLQSGRSDRAKGAAKSHTGALAGDYAVMRAHVEAAGGIVVDDLDELVDVAQLAYLYPTPPTRGIGFVSGSGAFGALMLDACERADVDVPTLSAESRAALSARLPVFVTPDNPLDLSTQVAFETDLQELAGRVLANDPGIGSILYTTPGVQPLHTELIDKLVAGAGASGKPVAVALWGDVTPMADHFAAAIRDSGFALSRSADRSVRALAHYTRHGRRRVERRSTASAEAIPNMPPLRSGVQPEWLGKEVLKAVGIAVPPGQLCESADQAVQVAERIGFPVALKAQSSEIPHKTEAGALSLGLADADAVRGAWRQLEQNVARAAPGVAIEGMLVEKMGPKGLDLMVGAKREGDWGPLLMVGLGGIWVEAFADVQLMTVDLSMDAMRERVLRLKTAKLLTGFRGAPAVDLDAVVASLAKLGRLMVAHPEIIEVDVNPLVAFPAGQGVLALDALIVTR